MLDQDYSATDLSNCDREPIHTPGSIQPHGFLFVLDPADWRVAGASTNARDFFWRDATALIGSAIADLLGESVVAALEAARSSPGFASRATFVGEVQVDLAGENSRFVLVAHAAGDHVILEGERASDEALRRPESMVQDFLAVLGQVESVAEMQQLVVREVRRITGFDRCLLYEFDADWNGTVVAEDRNQQLPTYLNQRFPASDIPKQARELYRRNRLRLIPTHTYKPVPIVLRGKATAAGELDLSLAVLRSVSPIHLEYMRNMGTGSAMSIAVLRDTELWGLISCHSLAPRFVPYAARSACYLLGEVFSLQLAAQQRAHELARRMELGGVMTRLMGSLARDGDFGAESVGEGLLRLMDATGAAIVLGATVQRHGQTPAEAELRTLAARVLEVGQPVVFWDHPSGQFPDSGAKLDPAVASGLLAVTVDEAAKLVVLWFRPEIIQVIEWGGEPRKAIEAHGAGRLLHPRQSFEVWRETVRGRSRRWEPAVLAIARDFRDAMLKFVLRRG